MGGGGKREGDIRAGGGNGYTIHCLKGHSTHSNNNGLGYKSFCYKKNKLDHTRQITEPRKEYDSQ